MGRDELKNTLRVQRAIKNITQEELAAAVGVTRKTVNTIENGVYTPSTALALRMARYFGVPVEEIFQLTETEIPR
jgi:putative transcriptional regulator